MTRPIVAVLEVMWGRTPGQAPRWFRINPNNFSGRRLIKIVGSEDFWVTNACRECVVSASEHPRPDAAWLRENLTMLAPRALLVCGRVAQTTFCRDMALSDCVVMPMLHPAARTITSAQVELYAQVVRAALVGA